MRSVRLLKPFGSLNVGEIGGYSDEQAARMIAKGVAEGLDREPETGRDDPVQPENQDTGTDADQDGEVEHQDPPPTRRRNR